MRGFFNPELGFFPFTHTVAYMLDVPPRVLDSPEAQRAMREVFDRNGSAAEAEAAVRLVLGEAIQ